MLEVNEETIPNAHHLKVFLSEALSHVPKAGDRAPFLYESYQPYQWGKSLSFRACDRPQWNEASLTGFSNFGDDATWTDGPMATIRLAVPPVAHDLLLKAQLGAFVHPVTLPEQNVKIFANGVPAGEWRFSDSQGASREIPLRKEWLGKSGKLVLRFEIDHPSSPRNLKIGKDKTERGLHFVSLLIDENRRDAPKEMATGALF